MFVYWLDHVPISDRFYEPNKWGDMWFKKTPVIKGTLSTFRRNL